MGSEERAVAPLRSPRDLFFLGILSLLFLLSLPPAWAGDPFQIKLTTNRYAINDDPMAGNVGSGGCINGSAGSWGTDYWNGEKVRIRAYALVLDNAGFPVDGVDVAFNLTYPNGSVLDLASNLTGSDGIANYSFSMNGLDRAGITNGTYTITASNTTYGISGSANFVYTYIGCTNCHGNPGADQLYSWTWVLTNSTPYSGNESNLMEPMHINYLGRNQHKATINNGQCTYCHTGYGYPTAEPSQTGGPAENPGGLFPWGVHSNTTGTGAVCWDCHLGARTTGAFPPAPDCYGARCHGANATVQHNTNLTAYTTWNANNQSIYSFYSDNVSNMSTWGITPLKAHKGTRNVPCILCHGPMHNITKPGLSPSQAENATFSNSGTEDFYCQTCHLNLSAGGVRTQHNGVVSCTVCHSQDVHNISYATNAGTAYTHNQSEAVDCRGCHQGNWSAILSLSKVGYTTRDAPQIPPGSPINHSDNSSGQRWGQYWGDFPPENGTAAVSAESATYGTTTGLSSAQTVDGMLETLTEELVTLPASDETDYVNSSSVTNGTIANFANMQSDGDGGAFANLSEAVDPASGTFTPLTNGDFATDLSSWTTVIIADPDGTFSQGWSNDGFTSGAFNQNVTGRKNSGSGYAYQDFTLSAIPNNATLDFRWAKAWTTVAPNNAQGHNITVFLEDPSGTNSTLWEEATLTQTKSWTSVSLDLKPYLTTTGTYRLRLFADLNTGNNNGAETIVWWDDVEVRYVIPTTYSLNITTNITDLPSDMDSYVLQIRANASGSESFNVTVRNSTGAYNSKGQISGGTMQQVNFTLNGTTEVLSGTVWVRFLDANASDGTLDSLYIDYERVNSSTSGSTNYRLDVVQNVTNVPLGRDSYNLTVRGNVTAGGENLDLYVYDFSSGQYVLKNASTFNASLEWHNFSLSSSEVSSGGVVSLQWLDSNRSGDGGTQDAFTLDFVGVYSEKGAVAGSLSCHYCHGRVKHNASALGRVAEAFQGTNYINGTINSTSQWCGACHYAGNPYYENMTSRLLLDTGKVPPLNTNYTEADGGFNHSNTLSSGASDSVCKSCHGGLISGTHMTEFVHNVQVGQACTGCHFSFTTMNGTYGRPTKYLNETMFTASVHGALDCLNCHTVTGNGTHTHPGSDPTIFTPPEYGWKWCEACHESQPVNSRMEPVLFNITNKTGRHNLTNRPSQTYYNISGTLQSALEITDCTACHDATLYNNAKATFNRSSGKDCRYCHTLPDKDPGSP
jgi:hypothetical protein